MTPKPNNLPAPADMTLKQLLCEMARILHNSGGPERGAGDSAALAAEALRRAENLPNADDLADWRSIRGDSVNWECNPISKRAGGYVEMMCNKMYWHSDTRHPTSCGGWRDMTLGGIADLGVRYWLRCSNIGPLGVEVIKWVIDEAAQGRVAYRATKGRAADAYSPQPKPMPPAPVEGVGG